MQHAVSGGVVLDATTASVPFGEEHVNNVHHLSTMSLQDNDMPSMKKQHSQSVPASLSALGDNSTTAGMKRVESWSVMEEGGVVVDATPTQDDSLDDVLGGGPPAAKAAASPPKPGINVAGRRARMPSGPGDEYAFLG